MRHVYVTPLRHVNANLDACTDPPRSVRSRAMKRFNAVDYLRKAIEAAHDNERKASTPSVRATPACLKAPNHTKVAKRPTETPTEAAAREYSQVTP